LDLFLLEVLDVTCLPLLGLERLVLLPCEFRVRGKKVAIDVLLPEDLALNPIVILYQSYFPLVSLFFLLFEVEVEVACLVGAV